MRIYNMGMSCCCYYINNNAIVCLNSKRKQQLENIMGETKLKIIKSDNHPKQKYKDIEDAIQKAIDTENLKKDSLEKSFNHQKKN